MKKRVLSTILALAMVLSMFAVVTFADDTTTTVMYDTSAAYGWTNYLNAVNVVSDSSDEDAFLRAEDTPYSNVLADVLAIMKAPGPGTGADGAYMNAYTMTSGSAAGQNLYDYTQDVFGAQTYTLRGGKKLAYDMWNAAVPEALALTYDDTSYTVVKAEAQDIYTVESYQAALDALKTYLVRANDNYIFNVDNTGLRTYWLQKERLDALQTALNNLEEPVVLIDLTDVTSANARLQMWIDTYNNIDVAEYKEKAEVQTWGAVLKAAAEDPSTASMGDAVDNYEKDGIAICSYWETSVRNVVPQSNGLKNMADEVWNDTANWPLGEVITDLNQTTYETEAYTAAYNQWANIRDVLRNQFATLKVSEALAQLDALKAMIQGLKEVDLPYDAEQVAAYNNLKAYIAIYDGRVARIVLEASKALDNYITLKNGVDRVHEIITDWEAGTDYATAEEMYGLISQDVSTDCTLEDAWMALRAQVGLDGGLPTFTEAYITQWTESGLYTDGSLAAVQETYLSTRDAMKQNSSLTDEGALQYIDTLKALLVEKEPELIDLTDITSENARLQMWIDTYNNIDVEEYKAKEEVQAWGAVILAAYESGTITSSTSDVDVDAYTQGEIAICGYWEGTIRNIVPQSNGLRAMADEIWNNGENWPLGENITDLNQTTYDQVAYTAAYNQWVEIRDNMRNQHATLKVSEALAALDTLKSMIQNLEEVELPYDAEQVAAYNNLKAYIAIYDGRVARIVLEASKALDNYITLKNGVDRVHEIITDWEAGTDYATAEEMYGLISQDVSTDCTLEDAWMALRAQVGLDGGLPTFTEAYITQWTESGLYTDGSLAAVQETYLSTRDAMKQNSSLTDEGALQYIDTLKALLVEKEPELIDLTDITSENARLQMWIDTYNNIDVEEYKEKEEVQAWGAVLKAAAEDPSTASMGDAVDNYEKDGIAICSYWETSVRKVVPQSEGLKAMADAVWNDTANWPLGSVVAGPDQADYVAEQYTSAYNKWVEIRETLRGQFATLKVSEALAELEELKSMIQSLEESGLPYNTAQLLAYNNLKEYIAIYDGRVARITLDANKQLENYITLKNGVDRVHEIIDAWEAGTEYATADEMYGLISKDVSENCTLEDAWMALRDEVGLEGGLYTFVEKHIAEWKDSGLYTADSLATMEAAYMSSRDEYKDITKTDADILAYIELLKASLVEAEKPVVPGDINGDGETTLCDIVAIARMVVQSAEFTEDQLAVCDVTGDGVVTLADIIKIARTAIQA